MTRHDVTRHAGGGSTQAGASRQALQVFGGPHGLIVVLLLLQLRLRARRGEECVIHAKNTIAGRTMPFELDMPRSRQWPGNPGGMAWRRHISRCVYTRNLYLKRDNSACNLILSVDNALNNADLFHKKHYIIRTLCTQN